MIRGRRLTTDQKAAFTAAAAARLPALRRLAFAVCGDWHRADDLAQDCLVRLYRSWPLRDEGSLDAWLRTTLIRRWAEETRTARWRRERLTGTIPDSPSRTADGTGSVAMRQLLDPLTRSQRACVVLRFLEDLSVVETAEILNVSPGTVKSQTFRALEILRRSPGVADDIDFLQGRGLG